jgi:hypothetical protein
MQMDGTFKAFRIHEIDKKIVARMERLSIDDLAAGEVVVRVMRASSLAMRCSRPVAASPRCTTAGMPSTRA